MQKSIEGSRDWDQKAPWFEVPEIIILSVVEWVRLFILFFYSVVSWTSFYQDS